MKLSPRFATAAGVFAVGLVTAGTAAAVQATTASASTDAVEVSNAVAAQSVDAFVKSKPSVIQPSSDEAYVQKSVTASGAAKYVAYDRTYKGLHVRGGDFVVVTDKAGATQYTSVAQTKAIGNLSTTPSLTSAAAETVAKQQLKTVNNVEGTTLVVYAADGTAKLAYETTINGLGAEGISRLTVDVDANTGAVLDKTEHVTHGTGTGWINGSVTINTTQSGSTYSMKDPNYTNVSCQDAANNTTFSGSDDVWGNGTGTNRETGCVDALYVAQKEEAMLSSWLGRNGFNGSGGGWPIRVGLNDQNAYYDGTQIQIGKNTAGQWIASADVVGHEAGHGIDDNTPGGISKSGTQEFVADTFGAATEWFANNPNDPPDYLVGEEINLVGSGPIRNMYNPSAVGDSNCYSSSTPGSEVHAAAGPGNHWFYLMAQGSAGNGQPASPTCNGSTVSNPLGIQNAIKVMYNAMLMKTSSSSYLKYRTWTLTAAKNLFPGSCTQFNTVKAAWDAVSVPAQSGDPTCSGGGTTPPPTTSSPTGGPTGSCSGQKLLNGGFESGSASWSGTTGAIGQWAGSGQAAHGGTYSAWLDGYGSTHTEAIQQSVTVPSGCRATLSFYVHIDSAETTTTTAYDKLTVTAGSTTLGTLSNLNKASGYQLKSYTFTGTGAAVSIGFSGTEDSSLQTSFVIDDAAVTLG
ncbi:M4 family metallopeptidase [Dactylosporangium matsuzakiense]|uniref:Zinc metalloprotease n=1 Tax=Dactylosporangium matsuzakiense TaxID=53360 RepID=A0A9W6KMC4_9ACTN|nr:M4 family metallopeptidase [Dactylosporangium matsuzakiense]UWZ42663.1 M4 family metallopeptidase [Dactylosporangium matsuzakiense]GLL03858.1 zinc metalloprotease [Dactylosporangium matsuzakiense]